MLIVHVICLLYSLCKCLIIHATQSLKTPCEQFKDKHAL